MSAVINLKQFFLAGYLAGYQTSKKAGYPEQPYAHILPVMYSKVWSDKTSMIGQTTAFLFLKIYCFTSVADPAPSGSVSFKIFVSGLLKNEPKIIEK